MAHKNRDSIAQFIRMVLVDSVCENPDIVPFLKKTSKILNKVRKAHDKKDDQERFFHEDALYGLFLDSEALDTLIDLAQANLEFWQDNVREDISL